MLVDDRLVEFTKTKNKIKPVIIRFVDGGPDQNPHNAKVISAAIDQFEHHNLDVLIVATNAPGRSCFNQVERRMAILSKKLAGVLLQHDKFGSHLDSQQRTIDVDLEKANFEHAGNLLAELWSELVISGFPTYTNYIDPDESLIDIPGPKSQEWLLRHVRTSQYMLQIVKCDEKACCSKFRSKWKSVVKGFLPPPIRVNNKLSE